MTAVTHLASCASCESCPARRRRGSATDAPSLSERCLNAARDSAQGCGDPSATNGLSTTGYVVVRSQAVVVPSREAAADRSSPWKSLLKGLRAHGSPPELQDSGTLS